jgi:hypothetical protein
LQENGYFVLRFLAQDVGKNLDLVLDAILRTLSHRRESNRFQEDRAPQEPPIGGAGCHG